MPNPQSSTSQVSNFSKPLQATHQTYTHRKTHSSVENSTRDLQGHKGWAEDCYAFELTNSKEQHSFEQGGIDIGIPTLPPPATLTSRAYPPSIFITAEEEAYSARQPRTHHRSLTSILPFGSSASRPNSHSPETDYSPRQKRGFNEFRHIPTGITDETTKVEEKKGGITSWFTGSSAPITVGVPFADQDCASVTSSRSTMEVLQRPTAFTEFPSRQLKRRPTASSTESTSPVTTPPAKASTMIGSRFNFFSTIKAPAQTTPKFQIQPHLDDEFLNLNIPTALFPAGPPSDEDPFSPSAFKNLLMNADGLLRKIQAAYKIRTLSLHELTQEKEVMREELEEAETRAQCLKNQLQGLGEKVAVQETMIADLANELAIEKKARAQEKEARLKSIALVHSFQKQHREMDKRTSGASLTVDTAVEDHHVDPTTSDRHSWRSSGTSTRLSIETDSDVESASAESVFSRSLSPALTIDSGMSTIDSSPEIRQVTFAKVLPSPALGTVKLKPVQQKSTFQKMLSSVTGFSTEPEVMGARNPFEGVGMGEEGCSNCCGKDASVAWDTVGLLRAENKGLKERVGDLEGAVDEALRCCLATPGGD